MALLEEHVCSTKQLESSKEYKVQPEKSFITLGERRLIILFRSPTLDLLLCYWAAPGMFHPE